MEKYWCKNILFFLCFSFMLSACTANAKSLERPVSKTALMLDTVITLTVYSDDADNILTGAFKLCEEYENMLSKTIETSDIYRINNSNNNFIEVSEDTVEVIKKAVDYSKASGGIFDITIGAAVNLWDFNSEKVNPALPDQQDITEAVGTTGYEQIEIDGNRVRLGKKGAQLDLGGIAKGFIADKIAEYLKDNNVCGAIINLGGNILTVGEKPSKELWTIGIQKPFSEKSDMIAVLSMPEKSAVSSGIYERYFKINDRIYHHILDTSTGYPISTDIVSVTIISDESVDGDALSTVAFGLGVEKGLEFIEGIPNTEAVFLTEDKTLYHTSGIGKDIPVKIIDNSYVLKN